MKVFVSPTSFRSLANQDAIRLLESFADEIVYNDLGVPLRDSEIVERLEGCDGYIAGLDYITADVVRAMPDSVRVISRYGAGIDRVDQTACRERGIILTNTPGVNAIAVCELAFGLMLALARNIPSLNSAVTQGEWPRASGIELAGKSLGIVGLGMIGKKLAIRARAFEMNVLAYDPFFDEAFAKTHMVERCDLDALITRANVLSLHVPLSQQTNGMMNAKRISLMPRGAFLINTSRGGLIDEDAAAEALISGALGGIGLDAFSEEPPVNSRLLGLERVVVTPHTGAHTAEAVRKMGIMSVENLRAVLEGQDCPYVIG